MIATLLSRYGYAAALGLLVGAGVGVPVPEEPIQLTAGVLAQQGILSLVPAIATCWLGIVVGDFFWFMLAQRLGPAVLERRAVRRVLTAERRSRLEAYLLRHAFLTVVISRHLSGFRLAAFALAATHGVRRSTFVVADGLSALVSVPFVVFAGYLGAYHLAEVRSDIRRVELAILGVTAVAVVVLLLVRRFRRGRAALKSSPRLDAARRGPA